METVSILPLFSTMVWPFQSLYRFYTTRFSDQDDVVDFLEHPIARIRRVQREPKRLQARDIYKGRDYDIVGTSYDPKTGQVTFPPRLSEAQRDAIRDSLVKPSQSETQDFLRLQRDGTQRILIVIRPVRPRSSLRPYLAVHLPGSPELP